MTDLKTKRHFFFDLDGTLCRSGERVSAEVRERIDWCGSQLLDVVIVSGAAVARIEAQVGPRKSDYVAMGQNGNDAQIISLSANEMIWSDELHWRAKRDVFNWISSHDFGTVTRDMVDDRGCQISFSLLGHHAPREGKSRFDLDGAKRRNLLARFPFNSHFADVALGGTTCLDFYPKSRHKGANIRRMLDRAQWEAADCVYFGDKLAPGGNDHSVLGVVECIEVRDPDHLLELLGALR